MANVLILYATSEGQTARIAERIRERLRGAGHDVSALRAREEDPLPEVAKFDAVIVGASVHYGHHPASFARALQRQRQALQAKPNAFFSVSLSADGPGANRPAAARYMRKFLHKVGWQPRTTVAFGGALRYSEYAWWKRELVRLFVRVAGGDTDISRDYEYTDWGAVAQFADAFSRDAA
ncbi:MAG TPA: menaquinone-dependent protoporphyrinogen IX dehydrogenase [Burkholderiales bacterium]|nr:menaquinone-dependent protoporphyrinogen IX dehydrogenase [Burkholderiales bacterium]